MMCITRCTCGNTRAILVSVPLARRSWQLCVKAVIVASNRLLTVHLTLRAVLQCGTLGALVVVFLIEMPYSRRLANVLVTLSPLLLLSPPSPSAPQ